MDETLTSLPPGEGCVNPSEVDEDYSPEEEVYRNGRGDSSSEFPLPPPPPPAPFFLPEGDHSAEEVSDYAEQQTEALRPEVREAIWTAMKGTGATLVRASQGLSKSTAARDYAAALARQGRSSIIIVPTRRLAAEAYWRVCNAMRGDYGEPTLLVGRAWTSDQLGVRGAVICSCTNGCACAASSDGLRAPGECAGCSDRPTCEATPGCLLHSLANLHAPVVITTLTMLRAFCRGGLPDSFRGRALILDDVPPCSETVTANTVDQGVGLVKDEPLKVWLEDLARLLRKCAGSLCSTADFGPPVALPLSVTSGAPWLLESAEIEHAKGRLPAGVLSLIERAAHARILTRRLLLPDKGVAAELSFSPAPISWEGPVVALDATGHLADYELAWPGVPWHQADIVMKADPARVWTMVGKSNAWQSKHLDDLFDELSPEGVEADVVAQAQRDLDLAEIKARAVCENRRAQGLPSCARVILPRKFLRAAPSLERVFTDRIVREWGFDSVRVDHWRSAVSRGTNSLSGMALTMALGSPRTPSSTYLGPPTVRAEDPAEFIAFWSRPIDYTGADPDGTPPSWLDPSEPAALERMIDDAADALDQEVRRDRAEVSSDGGPVLRYVHLPPVMKIAKDAFEAWASPNGSPAMLVDSGVELPKLPDTVVAGEKPAITRGAGVTLLGEGLDADYLQPILRAIREGQLAVVTTRWLETNLGMLPSASGRAMKQLALLGLGSLKIMVSKKRGRPAHGLLLQLGSYEEALYHVRRTHPEVGWLQADKLLERGDMNISRLLLEDALSKREAGNNPPAAVQHRTHPTVLRHRGLDGRAEEWSALPLRLGSKEGVLQAAARAEEEDPDKAEWAKSLRDEVADKHDGDDIPLGHIYRSSEGRLRDTNLRAMISGRLGARDHIISQPGFTLLDFDLSAAHPTVAWRWAGEDGMASEVYQALMGDLGIEREPAKKGLVSWLNGAGAPKLAEVTGTADAVSPGEAPFIGEALLPAQEAVERLFPKVKKLLENLRVWWESTPPGAVMDTRDFAVKHGIDNIPEAWHLRVVRPDKWTTAASYIWTRPEALWQDRALAIIGRKGSGAAVAVPIFDGDLVQVPISPWKPWRTTWLVGALEAQAEAVGLCTAVKVKELGSTWGGLKEDPPETGSAQQPQSECPSSPTTWVECDEPNDYDDTYTWIAAAK